MGKHEKAIAAITTLSVVVAVVCCTPVLDEGENPYNGYRVVRLQSKNDESLADVLQILQREFDVDVWSRQHHSADVMVGPQQLRHVRDVAVKHVVETSVIVDDVQRYLEADYTFRQHRRALRASGSDITNTYLTYPEMESYLYNDLLSGPSVANISVKSIGETFEGRNVHVVEIRQRGSLASKPAILIDAGIHAREWIAPAMALNIIHKLAFNPDNDPEVTDLLEKFDWFIVPSINPDGYAYSHKSATARLWRKTRTTKYSTKAYVSGRSCLSGGVGVDGNRNFAYDWNPSIGVTSNCPQSDVYAGPEPFSEPETRNIRDWLLSHAEVAKAYVTLHSFGQKLLYPYGSSAKKPVEDLALLEDVANAFKNKMRERNVIYVVGNSAAVLYAAAGGSKDYAKGTVKIPVSYTLELPPGSNDSNGFILPESKIARVVADTFEGLKALAQRLYDSFAALP